MFHKGYSFPLLFKILAIILFNKMHSQHEWWWVLALSTCRFKQCHTQGGVSFLGNFTEISPLLPFWIFGYFPDKSLGSSSEVNALFLNRPCTKPWWLGSICGCFVYFSLYKLLDCDLIPRIMVGPMLLNSLTFMQIGCLTFTKSVFNSLRCLMS